MNKQGYVVWIGGCETDYIVSKETAECIAASYIEQGFDDVVISEANDE